MEYLYAIALDLVLIWVPSKSHDQTRSSDSPEYNGPTPCSHLPSPLAPWINNQPDLWWYQFFRGMYPLTSRCFCSCLSCLPYSERARVRCLGLHSRNPAVEHFQERQWIQPPWNIALKIWSSNIYSILYMANNIHMYMALFFFLDMFTHLTFLTIWSHSLFSAASHLSFSFNIDRGTSR